MRKITHTHTRAQTRTHKCPWRRSHISQFDSAVPSISSNVMKSLILLLSLSLFPPLSLSPSHASICFSPSSYILPSSIFPHPSSPPFIPLHLTPTPQSPPPSSPHINLIQYLLAHAVLIRDPATHAQNRHLPPSQQLIC